MAGDSDAKAVYFGSLYALNGVGVDALVDNIRSKYPDDPGSAPFVSYEYDRNLLSCTIHRQDLSTPQFLLAQLKLFIDQERQNPQIIEPTIRPLEGALVRTEIDYSNTTPEAPGLIDVAVGTNGAVDPLEALQLLTTYWIPSGGDIKILTTAIAEEIARSTECSIYPEENEHRVRLVGGDFNAALRKLQNLEALLTIQHRRHGFDTLKTNGDVLLTTSEDATSIMSFERVQNPDHPAFRRIIVPQGPSILEAKWLCERRVPSVPTDESIPDNLALIDIADTNVYGRSTIWDRFMYPSIGDERNKNPRQLPDLNSKTVSSPPSSKIGVNDYIDVAKAARVEAWSGQIDENIDPNHIVPEPPEQPSGRRRRVAVDSDDEEEETPRTPNVETDWSRLQGSAVVANEMSSREQIFQTPREDIPHSTVGGAAPSDLLKSDVGEPHILSKSENQMPALMEFSTVQLADPPSTKESLVNAESKSKISKAARREPEAQNTNEELISISGADPSGINSATTDVLTESTNTTRSTPPSSHQVPDQPTRGGGPVSLLGTTSHEFLSTPALIPERLTSNVPSGVDRRDDDIRLNAHSRADPHLRRSNACHWQEGSVSRDRAAPIHSEMKPVDQINMREIIQSTSPTRDDRLLNMNSIGPSLDGLSSTLSLPSKSFNPHAYGAKTYRSSTSGNSQSILNIPSRSSQSTSPPRSGSDINDHSRTPPKKRGTRHRGRGGSKDSRQSSNGKQISKLIEFSKDDSVHGREFLPPTPGLGIQHPLSPLQEHGPHDSLHILDEQDDELKEHKALEPGLPGSESQLPQPHQSEHWPTPTSPTKSVVSQRGFSKSQASTLRRPGSRGSENGSVIRDNESKVSIRSDDSTSYVNTVAYKGPNITAYKETSLAKLQARRAEMAQRAQKAKKAKKSTVPDASRREAKSAEGRQSRTIMSQQAGNPGKKNAQKQESKAEKKKRLDQVMQAAYGNPPPAPTKPPKPQEEPQMSKKKRQLLKANPTLGAMNPVPIEVDTRHKVTSDLTTLLSPIFEASRAFCGKVQFEIQLGQLLVSDHQSIKEKVVSSKKWEKMFSPDAKVRMMTTFTPALTMNGADIDRALEIKSVKGGRLWDAKSPGPEMVNYEFECRSKHGKLFLLILNQDGSYELKDAGTTTIGMVGLHCPAQIWDACAVLCGVGNWTAPVEVVDAVKSFVDSIHILPNRHELALIFRQPQDNQITIKDVRLRRLSRHQCLITGHQHHELQVTEVKNLYTKVHPKDKKLWQAYERAHIDMAQDGMVHFEMSIIDKSVNQVLVHNAILELGDMAPPSAGKELLKGEGISRMVEMAAHMLSQIDWMGSQNFGTVARANERREQQQLKQQLSLPPIARSKIQTLMAESRIDPSSRVGGAVASVIGSGSTIGAPARQPQLPGTRYGTLASLYEDEHGMFRRGYGGARVPVGPNSVGLGTISELPLAPDDSASQIGAAKPSAGSITGSGRVGGSHGSRQLGYW